MTTRLSSRACAATRFLASSSAASFKDYVDVIIYLIEVGRINWLVRLRKKIVFVVLWISEPHRILGNEKSSSILYLGALVSEEILAGTLHMTSSYMLFSGMTTSKPSE